MIYDIPREDENVINEQGVPVVRPAVLPSFIRSNILHYIYLGIWLRLQSFDDVIHAHNASGFGLSAWLSNKNYIVTTYGTEIYQADRRGLLYKWLIKRVLHQAKFVTASTPHMADTLNKQFGLDRDRIFCQNVLDPAFISNVQTNKSHGFRTWFANRRMTELYCTLEVVRAFKSFLANGGKGQLILLEGDANHHYARKVMNEVQDCQSIKIVNGIVSQSEIIKILKLSHFSISVPQSDQLSSAILESAACEAVPIVRDLESYRPVSSVCLTVTGETDFISGLVAMFHHSAALSDKDLRHMGERAKALVIKEFSSEEFANAFEERVRDIAS
jgi:hypothetical protein